MWYDFDGFIVNRPAYPDPSEEDTVHARTFSVLVGVILLGLAFWMLLLQMPDWFSGSVAVIGGLFITLEKEIGGLLSRLADKFAKAVS